MCRHSCWTSASSSPSPEPWKAQPPVPPEEAAAVSLPLSPAWHPGLGRTRGRWVPRPSGLRGVRGAGRGCLGHGRQSELGGGARQRTALPGPGARRLSGLPPPPEAVGWAAPRGPPPWLPRGACWARRWDGGEAAPYLPDARAGKLRQRPERQPPCPHPPRSAVREAGSLRDPDSSGAGSRPPGAGLRPPLHVRPRPRWHGQGDSASLPGPGPEDVRKSR